MRQTGWEKIGASEGIRTLDIHLGKVTLYQTELRSLPRERTKAKEKFPVCKSCFQTTLLALLAPSKLLKVVNHDFPGRRLEDFGYEFQMERVRLIIILILLRRENNI